MANVTRIQAFKNEMATLLEKYQVEMDLIEDRDGYVNMIEFTFDGYTDLAGEWIPYEYFDLYGRSFTAKDFK